MPPISVDVKFPGSTAAREDIRLLRYPVGIPIKGSVILTVFYSDNALLGRTGRQEAV